MATINEIEEALQLFFNKSYDKDFIKSKLSSLQSDGEQPLLGYLAFYLLGWFGEKTLREQPVDHRLTDSGKGRVDFVIGKTAIEVAVRT